MSIKQKLKIREQEETIKQLRKELLAKHSGMYMTVQFLPVKIKVSGLPSVGN